MEWNRYIVTLYNIITGTIPLLDLWDMTYFTREQLERYRPHLTEEALKRDVDVIFLPFKNLYSENYVKKWKSKIFSPNLTSLSSPGRWQSKKTAPRRCPTKLAVEFAIAQVGFGLSFIDKIRSIIGRILTKI